MEREQTSKTNNQQKKGDVSARPVSSEPAPSQLHQLRGALGNRAFGKFIQAKLEVSQPGDVYEQEADRVADAVMAGSSSPIGHVSQSVQPKLYRREARLEDFYDSAAPTEGEPAAEPSQTGDTEEVQRSAIGEAGAVTSRFEGSLQQASGGGEPLPLSTRSLMENRFGSDFSAVRVHSDARAHTLAREVNARAFTLDHDIFFAGSEYQPDSNEGQHLLAHELTHVVQQSEGRLARKIQRNTSCSAYPAVTGAAINTYNCAGLALRTYTNIPAASLTYNAVMANFTMPRSPAAGGNCGGGAVKFWLWEYDHQIEDDLGRVVHAASPDFHVVGGRADVAGNDPTDVFTKNGFRPVHGPGLGASFRPAARAPNLVNDATEAPNSLAGHPLFSVRTNMTETMTCADCYP